MNALTALCTPEQCTCTMHIAHCIHHSEHSVHWLDTIFYSVLKVRFQDSNESNEEYIFILNWIEICRLVVCTLYNVRPAHRTKTCTTANQSRLNTIGMSKRWGATCWHHTAHSNAFWCRLLANREMVDVNRHESQDGSHIQPLLSFSPSACIYISCKQNNCGFVEQLLILYFMSNDILQNVEQT